MSGDFCTHANEKIIANVTPFGSRKIIANVSISTNITLTRMATRKHRSFLKNPNGGENIEIVRKIAELNISALSLEFLLLCQLRLKTRKKHNQTKSSK